MLRKHCGRGGGKTVKCLLQGVSATLDTEAALKNYNSIAAPNKIRTSVLPVDLPALVEWGSSMEQ